MQQIPKSPHAASAAVAILWLSWERRQSLGEDTAVSSSPVSPFFILPRTCSVFPISKTLCESNPTTTTTTKTSDDIPTPSRFRRALAAMHICSLPLPRRLVANDPVFNDGTLQRGLRQRARDEQKLRKLQQQVIKAVEEKQPPESIRKLHDDFCQVAYGENVTPQQREDFIIRYGCTGWTDQVLETLITLAETRGIVEIGAGNGQWARVLVDKYKDWDSSLHNARFEFVLAYDDMSELPLSPEIYHQHTQPAHDYFYERVKKCDSIESALGQWPCRGRVLLVVYPPPGPMAVEAVKFYAKLGLENDTVAYVGEGRGGANANDALFDYFESGEWAILDVLPVKIQPGGKGYEKCFILKRIKTDEELKEFCE